MSGPVVRFFPTAWRVAVSFVIVAATTAFCLVASVNPTTAGFAYLIGILGIAAAWGLVEAIATSLFAMLCYNYYFLPPVGQFVIADPQNWIALFAFLATALVASHLSDRAKKQALEAKQRQRETEQLYAFSRAVLLSEAKQSIGAQAVRHIAQIFECRVAALYDAASGEVFYGGPDDQAGIEARLKQSALEGVSLTDAAAGNLVAPVTLGGRPIGSLALTADTLSAGALQGLLHLLAIALERVRTEEAANRAEIARRSEEFKSTLLDAIAHEFKTPLTSIKAASTSILTDSASLSAQHRELTTIIDEETDRLSILVTEAVRMSQIDAGKIHLDKHPLAVKDLLDRVLAMFTARLEGREVDVAAGESHVAADPDLIVLAIRQLIDNALKYSPAGSPIDIRADGSAELVTIRVRDRGAGIPERDRERVFDKFYRRDMSKGSMPGSGLGLHFAREIIRAHGGDLWVESEPGAGSEFSVTLPASGGSDKA